MVARQRREKAENPDVFKVKRYPAGDAKAEKRAQDTSHAEAMLTYREARMMQVVRRG